MNNTVGKLIHMDPATWETTKLIARENDRSASAQVRHWIKQGIRLTVEDDRLNEIEANAKVIELHEDRTA